MYNVYVKLVTRKLTVKRRNARNSVELVLPSRVNRSSVRFTLDNPFLVPVFQPTVVF